MKKKYAKLKKTQLQERTFLCYYHTYLCKKIMLEFFFRFPKTWSCTKLRDDVGSKIQMFLIFDSPCTIFLPPYTLSHIYRSGILVEYIDRQKRLHWRLFQAHFILFRIVSSFKFTFYLALSTINKVSLFPIFLGRVSIFFCRNLHQFGKIFSLLDNVPN